MAAEVGDVPSIPSAAEAATYFTAAYGWAEAHPFQDGYMPSTSAAEPIGIKRHPLYERDERVK